MIAARIGPDIRFAVVAAKAYFARHPMPQMPRDLVGHRCINLRFPTLGGLYAWEFEKEGRELKVRVDGQPMFNGIFQILDGALTGLGPAYVPEGIAEPHLPKGVWCACLRIGARRGQGIIFITPRGVSNHLRSRCS